MFQYHPSNPFRSCSWRWESARIIREGKVRGAIKKFSEDAWVVKAYKFQRELATCKDEVDRYDLMDKYPELYGAYLIYQRGEEQDRHPLRFAIEARILADQDELDISTNLGISPKTVQAYEKLFFNVKEKLSNQDYIMTCVIGPSVHAGMSDRDYDLLWKLFGYLYGPAALDAFIHTTTRRHRPETLADIDATLAEAVRSSVQRKVAVVARTYTVNPFSQSELLNIYARLLEMEKEDGGEKNRDVILQNVQVMLDKLPFRAGEDDIDQPMLLNKYDSSAIELHTHELLDASMGKDVNDVDIAALKFPEPKPEPKPKSESKHDKKQTK